jgi:predicted transcriptional regulator
MKTSHAFLISIRPRFAEMIFAGSKTVELRRVCPKVSVGDLALVYVSSPAMELRGSFEVGKILTASPAILWKKVGEKSGVTRAEFFAYFKGKKRAHALVIKRAWPLPAPVGLKVLRRSNGGFRPPQNFHYLNRTDSSLLVSLSASQSN